jgi:hypothetical protein
MIILSFTVFGRELVLEKHRTSLKRFWAFERLDREINLDVGKFSVLYTGRRREWPNTL